MECVLRCFGRLGEVGLPEPLEVSDEAACGLLDMFEDVVERDEEDASARRGMMHGIEATAPQQATR